MSDLDQLHPLLAVSQVKYDFQRQAFAKLVQEESALRGELARLNEMGQTARLDIEQTATMKAIGADLLWQGWLGRTRTELNLKLARVLARKENEKEKVRRAFGKVTALRELIEAERLAQRKVRAQLDLENAVNTALNAQ